VIYASDNGPENSWRERVEEFGHHSNGIYRGGKRDIYEGGHRVPFFMRWPAGIKESGRSCDDLVGLVDLLATFADIVGAELPADAGEDSQSFAQILNEPDTKRERLPLINHGTAGRFAITEGHWKLVMAHKDETLEFYNLADDPGEMKNVVDDHPELVAELAKKITDIVCNGRTTAGDVQANDTGYWDDLTWVSPDDYQERQNTTS
ncbi:MAG: sulfatase-like hydrolase/transferase, partial [Candidatus Latescibacteria bacterium]|nr:sulfatase-like hydrolase/transferase [Candidatus Latescibacterota bacterium]